MFGPVAQIAVPDFAQTLARAQDIAARRDALQRQNALTEFFQQNAQGFASADPNKRMNLLAMLAQQGGQGAAMALPQMQALREEMEWSGAGQQAPAAAPAAQPAVMQVPAGQGGDYLSRLIRDESGGDPNARNPRSSATGAAQFIDGTWMRFAEANPQRFAGMTREQILAARNDPALSREAADWYRRENLAALSGQGLPANDGTAALAHRFGAGDAARLLRADQNAPIATVVSDAVMRANPDLAGRSVGNVVGQYQQRFGGAATPAQAAAPGAPAAPRDGGLPPVPGFDMDRVRRAINLPNNAAAQRYLQSYMQAAQVLRREAEPLEIVEGPNGPIMVPRSQAVGQRPASRETAPRSPDRFEQDRALAEAGAARNTTNVNPGETAFERERGKTLAERAAEWEAASARAAQTTGRLNRFEALNRQFTTGALANTTLTAGQLAQRLGIPDSVLSGLGISRDQVAAGEGLRSLTSQMLVGLIGSGGFPAQNFSNADREMLERALPALVNSPNGNAVIISILRASVERDRAVGAAWRQWVTQNGESADSVRRFQIERVPELTGQDILVPILQDAVPANMPDAPRGVQAEPPARVPAPPRHGEVRDGFRFRGGNPADRNAWEAVR